MAKKRADGRLQRKITIDGKQYFVYGKTVAELSANEAKKRAEIERGVEQHDNPTLKEYYDEWTESRRGTIRENTLRGQISIFNVMADIDIPELQRKFGEIKLKKITVKDLRYIQRELLKIRKTQTVNDYLAHIGHCLNSAIKDQIITYNPYTALAKLKRTEERARDTHHRALSLDEQTAFFSCDRCKNSFYYNALRFAVSTGMRIGEIGALKVSDIKNGFINVERTITRTESGAYIIGESAKTEAGRRSIPMTDQVKSIVSDQKKLNKMLSSDVISMDGLLFHAPEGGLLQATPIDREIKRICKATGIEFFTMHALRDTFATRAIESGMNPKTLQEILGHSSFNITMSLYGHCMPDTKKKEMELVKIVI